MSISGWVNETYIFRVAKENIWCERNILLSSRSSIRLNVSRISWNVPRNHDVDLNSWFPDKIMIDFSLTETARDTDSCRERLRGKDFLQTEFREHE